MSMSLRHVLASLASADVWDDVELDPRPVPETIANLREFAYTLTLQRGRVDDHRLVAAHCDESST